MTPCRVFLYVQHLLGIGHLQRAAGLSRAMAKVGIEVTLVSGGVPVKIDSGPVCFIQLPPVRAADSQYSALETEDGRAVDDAFRRHRTAALLDAFHAAKPDILITEQFPFGRRPLHFELLPLLDAAKTAGNTTTGAKGPAIVASVRDILVAPSRPERFGEMLELAQTRYDCVLVHGDPALIPFSATFPHAAALGDALVHTGYVRNAPQERSSQETARNDEVLVAAGGGGTGEVLFRTALEARPLSSLATAPWRILAGDRLASDIFEDLRHTAPEGVVVERARPDYRMLLANCTLSISQAGYNTILDLLEARPRAVLAPVGGGQTEQATRARCLKDRAGFEIVEESDLSPAALAVAIDRAAAAPPIRDAGIDLDGAARSAEIVLELMGRRRTA